MGGYIKNDAPPKTDRSEKRSGNRCRFFRVDDRRHGLDTLVSREIFEPDIHFASDDPVRLGVRQVEQDGMKGEVDIYLAEKRIRDVR